MTVLITGSLAYDNIMMTQEKFTDTLTHSDDNSLNIAFLIQDKYREFGGCAGNISYNLSLLGEESFLIGRAGKDFDDYEEWLVENGINTDHIIIHEDVDTAIAYITTDKTGAQITGFYPGAMSKKDVFKPKGRFNLAIISPEDIGWMQKAVHFCQNNIPYIYDSGQQTLVIPSKDLEFGVFNAQVVIVNNSESIILLDRLNIDLNTLIAKVPIVIITNGEKGSEIYAYGKKHKIGIAKPKKYVEPTGCGDAYRAGIIIGMTCGFDWELTGQIAATAASFVVEEFGTQNHFYELEEFNTRLKKNFNKEVNFE